MTCEVFNETDFGMIEGSRQILRLNLYNIMGEAYENILLASVEWRLSKYGETEVFASKNTLDDPKEIVWDDEYIEVVITETDTLGLYGKFIHQLVLEDMHGSIFIADLGRISIKPQIR